MEYPKVARQKMSCSDFFVQLFTRAHRDYGMHSRQKTQEANSGRPDNRKMATMSWYGRLLIISMLLVAAGWELFRLIVAIITLD